MYEILLFYVYNNTVNNTVDVKVVKVQALRGPGGWSGLHAMIFYSIFAEVSSVSGFVRYFFEVQFNGFIHSVYYRYR